jgi:hypothetical protein
MIRAADIIMTDALPAYSIVPGDRRSVKHSAKEFARTDPDGVAVHVNTAESVHADLRRMVLGVHHWISPKHLDRYLDDLAFRRSLRSADVLARLAQTLVAPGRLLYRDLVASS